MEIASAVLPLFAGNDGYSVESCEVTENRLYLKILNKRLEMEVRKGDIVQAGHNLQFRSRPWRSVRTAAGVPFGLHQWTYY